MSAETTENICPACSKPGTGGHCTYCSEVMLPERITLKHIFHSIPDVFFDVEHGLFYSIKTFIKHPGETIRRYYKGDRQRHYKPLKFVLFLGGLYAFLFISFGIHSNSSGYYEELYNNSSAGKIYGHNIDLFSQQWDSLLRMIQFPLIALITWALFRKLKYNYGEHFVANAYFIGEVSLYQIILFPVYYLVNGSKWIDILNYLSLLWILFYYVYAFYDWLYHRKTTKGLTICILLVVCLFILIQYITFLLSPVLYDIKVRIWGS